MRILVIEDDPDLGEALAEGLRQAGHAVDWFRDGTQADAALSGAPFDAMVLDLGLPGTDGMGWLRIWRGRGVTLPYLSTLPPMRRPLPVPSSRPSTPPTAAPVAYLPMSARRAGALAPPALRIWSSRDWMFITRLQAKQRR